MLKKLLLIALCSTNLCAANPLSDYAVFNPKVSASESIWLGIMSGLLLDVAPRVLKSYSDENGAEENYKVRLSGYLLTGAQISFVIYTTIKLCAIAKGIYDYNFPTEAEMAIRKAAAQMNKIFDAKEGLRSCLMSNARTPRNDAGLPTACESLANAYHTVAGQPALDEMTTNFKDTYAYKGY